MKEYIRPSEYAKLTGVHYRTALRHFHSGFIDGKVDKHTGTIWLKNPEYEEPKKSKDRAVLYARVSSTVNRASLDGQIERLRNFAAAKGLTVVSEVKEIASGLNDSRPKLMATLAKDDWDFLLVEHKDRLTRFGFNYFRILSKAGQAVLVINEKDNAKEELMDDFISIITSFCGRIYGANRKKKTEAVIQSLNEEK